MNFGLSRAADIRDVPRFSSDIQRPAYLVAAIDSDEDGLRAVLTRARAEGDGEVEVLALDALAASAAVRPASAAVSSRRGSSGGSPWRVASQISRSASRASSTSSRDGPVSPEYATVQSNADSNLNGDSAPDRSIVNSSGVVGTSTLVTPLTNSSGATVAYLATNPNAYYIQAGPGALATDSRNTLGTPPINNWDFALVKRFNITERFRFDIGAQAFNLFNHAQFVGSFINDSAPDSTAAISRNFLVPSNPLFGAYNQGTAGEGFFGSNARTMQLTAHFTF